MSTFNYNGIDTADISHLLLVRKTGKRTQLLPTYKKYKTNTIYY